MVDLGFRFLGRPHQPGFWEETIAGHNGLGFAFFGWGIFMELR
jgi:hypothetical protein